MEKIFSKRFDTPNSHKLETYLRDGGYEAAKKAITTMTPDQVIATVKNAKLRGLGGAAFSTGMKWSFIPKDNPNPKFIVVNADEGEPGTFKDRYIIVKDPHLMIEGIIIACFAIGSHKSYIYIRGEYVEPAKILEEAVAEAYAKGYLGKNIMGTGYNVDIVVHRGAGAYICGEETALLESLEGKKGFPRLKPPFPAIKGLFGCPTAVNNVETLAAVPSIIKNGAEWFAALGTEKNGGTRLYSVSGHVKHPGVYELPVGITLRTLIYEHAGGIRDNRKLKAVIPGGISASILTADEIDVKMDPDSLAAAGTMIGSAGVMVMDETTCMLKALQVAARFFAHESCGQCSPCREGCGWMEKIIDRIVDGHGRIQDLDNVVSIGANIAGRTICAFGDAAPAPVISYIKKFRSEFEHHIRTGTCDILGDFKGSRQGRVEPATPSHPLVQAGERAPAGA